LFFCQLVYAECENENALCVQVEQWNFSLGIGGGIYTNPLHDGDDIPLILVPSISYYGERLFFQNNTLGYTLYENKDIALSAITLLNTEKAFFKRWHPQNILIPDATSDVVEQGYGPTLLPSTDSNFDPNADPGADVKDTPPVSIEEVTKRKWALDTGIQLNWFLSDTLTAEVKLLHDVNNAYQGFNASAEFSKVFKVADNSLLELSLGAQWNSKALVDYYYGVRSEDTTNSLSLFEGKASVNPYINIGYAYKLNDSWQLKAFLKRKKLSANTYLSPLVKKKTVDLIFIGFFYEF